MDHLSLLRGAQSSHERLENVSAAVVREEHAELDLREWTRVGEEVLSDVGTIKEECQLASRVIYRSGDAPRSSRSNPWCQAFLSLR